MGGACGPQDAEITSGISNEYSPGGHNLPYFLLYVRSSASDNILKADCFATTIKKEIIL